MSGYFSIRDSSFMNVGNRERDVEKLYQPDVPEMSSPRTQLNTLLNNRYRILELVERGVFSNIFWAMDEQQDSTSFCVVKQLYPSTLLSRQEASEFFHQEAQCLAELGKHPQISQLLDTFEQDEQTFIVQEWIDGQTLEQEVEVEPFDEVEIWRVLRELLPVLQYCHERQIIHRNIKPTNIIHRKFPVLTPSPLNKDGKMSDLVLVDFGAAKHLRYARSIQTRASIGSAEYAAPEELRGHAVFASDLYSLGITCLYLLTQMSPFDLYDVSKNEWKWQEYLVQPISPSLEYVLCKLFQSKTRQRYQSAAEVLADLDASSILTGNSPTQLESAIAGAN